MIHSRTPSLRAAATRAFPTPFLHQLPAINRRSPGPGVPHGSPLLPIGNATTNCPACWSFRIVATPGTNRRKSDLRKVLYIDGEMPLTSSRERICDIVAGTKIDHPLETLKIITADLQDRSLPDLSTIEGQDQIEPYLDGVSLLVLDNLSALVRAVKENEGEGWLPIQDWALDLRRRGTSILFVHHAGKGGLSGGTSRREDLLDSVVTLKNPSGYVASEGLRCEVLFEKARGFYGDDAKPFEVKMTAGAS